MNQNIIISNDISVGAPRPDYKTEVMAILRSRLTPRVMRERILDHHQNDIAAAMALMTPEERQRLYTVLDTVALAGVFEYAEPLAMYIDELGIRKKIDILSLMEASVSAEYLGAVDKATRKTLLDLMNEDIRAEIALVASFDEDEIGSRMTTNFVSVMAGSTVKAAMSSLIAQAADNDNISTIYVVEEDGTLLGAIDLKDLIMAREGTDLAHITMTSYPYVYAGEQIEDCIARIRDYSEDSIPVLDSDNKLCGVLISQDMTDLIGDMMGEDYAMLAGLSAEEDLYEPMKKSMGKRLPWLTILLALGLLVSSVVGIFEHVVAHLSLIVCFQSLILGMSGNIGTQSLAVTIRVLMDDRVGARQKLYLVGKEVRVGFINGLILGVLSFVFIGAYLVLLKEQAPSYAFSVSLCTGLAMLISIILASITGTVVPMIFKRLGIDPAVASGPLITTVNDLVAVVSYYGLAWLFLIRLLGL